MHAPYVSLTKPQRIVMATIVFKYVATLNARVISDDARSFSCVSLTGDIEPAVRDVHLRLITKVDKTFFTVRVTYLP
jgi:hypothetical protein